MSTRHYVLPVEQTQWTVEGSNATVLSWDYDDGRDRLLSLYEKGKARQWDAKTRLIWSLPIDLNNPLGADDSALPIYGSPFWDKLNEKERGELRLHFAAWQFSQFLHGEQGALICTSKIVQTVPHLDAKFYAATQVMDEARHVEVYSRYLHEKLQVVYPVNKSLKLLLEQAIADRRWDFTYLAMQVIIEGLALASFQLIRDYTTEPLARALTAYVMQDEARHVAFGRLALRDYYPQLTSAERAEREEFVIEACRLMRSQIVSAEVYERFVGDACLSYIENSDAMRGWRKLLFGRIVPTIKDIGLWGPNVRRLFEEFGVIAMAEQDVGAIGAQDEKVAEEFDRLMAARKQEIETAAQ